MKRALTDPHIFSGIGNAYSDEILHAARMSPMKLTATLGEDEIARLYEAAVGTLARWIRRLRDDGRRRVSREGECLSRGHGGSRPLSSAMPGVRRAGAADRATPATKPTTAPSARPAGDCSPIAHWRDFSGRTGRRRSTRWNSGSDGKGSRPIRADCTAVLPSRDAEEPASRDCAPRIRHGGVIISLTTGLALVPRVRSVDVITVFGGAFGAGAAFASAVTQFRALSHSASSRGAVQSPANRAPQPPHQS